MSEELDNVGASWEGWSNRPTWCANLWIANEQGPYLAALEIGAASRWGHSRHPELDCGLALVEMLTDWIRSAGPGSAIGQDFTDNETGKNTIGEIDVQELGAAWIAEAKEQADWAAANA
jgi:hypothetical protein